MSEESSPRLALPLLQPGQVQKEADHNEALALLDLAVQAVVEAVGMNAPPGAPAEGACWIVGSAPLGAWAGHAGALAGWSAGGWRFVGARDGMSAWSRADAATAQFHSGAWVIGDVVAQRVIVGGVPVVGARQAAIAAPAGGITADAEARAAIAAMLNALRAHGLIAP